MWTVSCNAENQPGNSGKKLVIVREEYSQSLRDREDELPVREY